MIRRMTRQTYYVYVDGAIRPYGTTYRMDPNHDGLGITVTPRATLRQALRAAVRRATGADLPPAPLRGDIDLY